MNLNEDGKIQKFGKKGRYCLRNVLLPYEDDWTCIACGNNVIERKYEFSINSR